MSGNNTWDSVLAAIEKRVNHESFVTWFKPISFISADASAVLLKTPDQVFGDWILNNYRETLEEALEEVGLAGLEIKFLVASTSDATTESDSVSATPSTESQIARPAISVNESPAYVNEREATSSRYLETPWQPSLSQGLPLDPILRARGSRAIWRPDPSPLVSTQALEALKDCLCGRSC